jgi:hypothetical protein
MAAKGGVLRLEGYLALKIRKTWYKYQMFQVDAARV